MVLDNLTKVHANSAPITPHMVLVAIIGAIRDHEVPTYARMNKAQSVAWTNSCNHCFEYDPKGLPMPNSWMLTVGGLPIQIDPKLWPSTVVFHNAEGKAVARIQGLAIPCGLEGGYPTLWNCDDLTAFERRIADEGWLFE
jgi:hypothetical protein